MRVEHKIVVLSVACGSCVWPVGAFLNHGLFYRESFWESPMGSAPAYEFCVLAGVLALFIIWGVPACLCSGRRGRANASPAESADFLQPALDGIPGEVMVTELDYGVGSGKEAAEVIKLCQGVTEPVHTEQSVERDIESVVRATGQEFFDKAAAHLCLWLGVECAMIGRLVSDNRVMILSGMLDGRKMEGVEYALAETPCETVMRDGYLICPERASTVFPKAGLLAGMNAEGYVGAALLGKDGSPIGICCAMSRGKLNLSRKSRGVMQIVGAKAAAEIEHIDTLEQMLKDQEELAHISCLSGMEETMWRIAHQLSQPLCAMINYTGAAQHLLKSDAIDASKLAGHLTAAMQQAERAGKVIKGAIDRAEKYEPRRTKVDINRLVREVSGLVTSDAHRHDTSVSLQLAAQLPAVSADPLQVKQVLLSLVHNSIEAMIDVHAGKRGLCVRTSGTEDSVEVAVGNTGKGVSDETCTKMFDPSFAARPNGLGMGLSVSRSIIEAHGGRLWADVNPDRIMSFRFTLPVTNTI